MEWQSQTGLDLGRLILCRPLTPARFVANNDLFVCCPDFRVQQDMARVQVQIQVQVGLSLGHLSWVA